MANRFTRYLTDLLPRTGRLIREDGTPFNQADYLEAKNRDEISVQSVLGNAYAASWRGVIAGNATVDLVLAIPADVKVYFHLRQQAIVGGQLEWELREKPDAGYAVVQTIHGQNVDRAIGNQSGAAIVETSGVTGSTFLREGIIYPAGTGSNRTSATTTSADAVPQYVQEAEPVLRLNNTNGEDMLTVVNFIWAELPRA